MYKIIALLKEPLVSWEELVPIIQSVCDKLLFSYQGYKLGEYGSKKEGFQPLYCFRVKYQEVYFDIVYQNGLGSFQNANTLDFSPNDFKAKIEISSTVKDFEMEYLTSFTLLCESIEKEMSCMLIQYNSKTKQWERV